jgi:hypothetical protein
MSNPNVAAKKATTKKRKKRGSDVGCDMLLNQGFTNTPISKCINQKIAMTDKVYEARDIYLVMEELSSPPSTNAIKLKCRYDNERIKANSPQSKVKPLYTASKKFLRAFLRGRLREL